MPIKQIDGLNYPLLLQHIGPARARFDVDWIAECDSSNTVLLDRAARGAPSGSVLLADSQTAGRGRRGRSWLSTPDCSLTFSLLWRLPLSVSSAGLSLAVGLAVAQAMESLGFCGLGLKWPNDIWLNKRKLGGVLIEAVSKQHGSGFVIGIGLNLQQHPAWAEIPGLQSAALSDVGLHMPREAILGAILQTLAQILDTFSRAGFESLRDAWCARNALLGLRVQACSERSEINGICGNVSSDGALILHTYDGAHLLITGGDVSLALLAN